MPSSFRVEAKHDHTRQPSQREEDILTAPYKTTFWGPFFFPSFSDLFVVSVSDSETLLAPPWAGAGMLCRVSGNRRLAFKSGVVGDADGCCNAALAVEDEFSPLSTAIKKGVSQDPF